MRKFIIILVVFLVPVAAHAELRIFACEPEWGSLARELTRPETNVFVATTGQQDPHYIQARPSLIAQARRADLLICNGADLEVGWLPLLLQRSGNVAIQPGQPGYFMAADQVALLDLPESVDRSQGDIHPYGNPHIHLDPARILQVAIALSNRLQRIDAGSAAEYARRQQAFVESWNAASERWKEKAAAIRDLPFVANHSEWRYLQEWTGMRIVAHIEAKPGIPPSSGHLAHVLAVVQRQNPVATLAAPGRSTRGGEWLHARGGPPVVELPYTVGGSARAVDLYSLFDETLNILKKYSR